MILKYDISPEDRPRIAALLASLEVFTEDERAVALELCDHRLDHPSSDDYRFILAFAAAAPDKLAGYLCYGRTPMTQSTYDLYWLGTSPELARSGVARRLVSSMEDEIARAGGGLIRVETGSREGHGAAVHFYDAVGFTRSATLGGFYAPDDDLIIFTRRVPGAPIDDAPELAEAALHDAAFGYRSFAAERDFLLTCARRFGAREVRRVLAWSAGTGRHARAFAEAGIACVSTDPSERLVAYAKRQAPARAGADLTFLSAPLDARPEVKGRFDLSFVPLSAIHSLVTPEAIERHLRVAAELLGEGGLHVIEATHPHDLLPGGVNHTEWTEVRGDTTVEARFRMHADRATEDRVVPVTLEVARSIGGKKNGGPRWKQEDRWFIPDLPGFRAIIERVPELRLSAALGDFNVGVPFEHPAAWRLILVLARA